MKKTEDIILETQKKIDEIEKDIKGAKVSIADKDIPDETKVILKDSLVTMQKEATTLKSENETRIKELKKEKEKPILKVDGKLYEDVSHEEIGNSFKNRLDQVDKLEGLSKTKSVVQRTLPSEAAEEGK